MDIDFIEKLIETVGRSPIEELELERDGWRIRIVKSPGPAPAGGTARETSAGRASEPRAADTAVEAARETGSRRHVVRAFLTGTFYRSATENGPPLVAVGDRVEEGQHLAILEAMKVLNPIEAPLAGSIVEILAGNADAIQTGDPLIVVEAD